MRAQAEQVLDAALAAGVRHLDAARSYGDAELFLAGWLARRGLAPGSVRVASKWGYVYEAGWRLDAPVNERKDHSVATLRRQAAESLALLGSHLALYQIHSATPESGVLEDAAVLGELERLVAGGIQAGVTVSGPSQGVAIQRATAIRRGGRPLFSTIQATWNLLERSAEGELARAHDAGHLVVVKEALANGLLTDRGTPGRSPELAALAAAKGATVDAVALAAALAQPWADVVLLGASTPEQLGSNLGALAVGLTEAELRRLGALRAEPRAYWEARAHLKWS
jgi:aryl-alcohol dehydrogenase-like predicted oxidoreductase